MCALNATAIVAAQLKRKPVMQQPRRRIMVRSRLALFWIAMIALSCGDDAVTDPQPEDPVYNTVSTGDRHVCATTAAGTAWCWGGNHSGQLGDGSAASRATPAIVESDVIFEAISAGSDHTCGLDRGGSAWCWGANEYGQLGIGTSASALRPVQVLGGIRFQSIHAAWNHTCGLHSDGRAYCWGVVESGFLEYAATPTPVAPDLTFEQLDSNHRLICGLDVEGNLLCWGVMFVTYPLEWSTQPQTIAEGLLDYEIDAGTGDICGLSPGGAIFCWLGDESFPDVGFVGPYEAAGGTSFTALATGSFPMCGVTLDGAAVCWRPTVAWKLWDQVPPEPAPFTSPEETDGLSLVQVSRSFWGARADFTCGISDPPDDDSAVYCWGDGNDGQLGNGIYEQSDVPVRVQLP